VTLFTENPREPEKWIGMAKILVVEDEPNIRKLVAVNLAQRGHRVLEAENGQQALEHLNHQKPALLVLDIRLPDLSGWDILDHIITVPTLSTGLLVLVITASPVDPNNVLHQYPCVAEVIAKPFDIDRLIRAIQRVLLMP
jgi:two-component system, response regulator, stage 0 sporulation protein F